MPFSDTSALHKVPIILNWGESWAKHTSHSMFWFAKAFKLIHGVN